MQTMYQPFCYGTLVTIIPENIMHKLAGSMAIAMSSFTLYSTLNDLSSLVLTDRSARSALSSARLCSISLSSGVP